MSQRYDVFRVRGEGGGFSKWGTAFLIGDDTLITCRHVVTEYPDGNNNVITDIKVLPNIGENPIKCYIAGWDTEEDKLKEATVVVLKTEDNLFKREMPANGSVNDGPLHVTLDGFTAFNESADPITISSINEVSNKQDPQKGIQCYDTKEWVNRNIEVENKIIYDYEGLSGSPIYSRLGDPCGIFVAHKAYENGPSIFGYGYCDQAFHDSLRKALEMAKRKEREKAQQKALQSIPTFAEYVAEACHDRPDGLRVLYDLEEYKRKYPNYAEKISDEEIEAQQSNLENFLFQICDAGREIDGASAKKKRDLALRTLGEFYGNNPQYILDMYISGLYSVLLDAYIENKKEPHLLEAAIILLEVAAEKLPEDFPQRYQFLTECYLALDKDTDAQKAIEQAKKLCKFNTNCYADIQILSTCCRTAEGEEMGNADVLDALRKAYENRPEGCEGYLCATGARRMWSYYLANNLDKPDFEYAANSVKEAFNLDSLVDSEDGRKEDDVCFKHIYLKALDYYTSKGFEGYKDWHEFRTKVAQMPLYDRIEGENLKPQEDEKWRSSLNRWNCNGRNSVKETLKSTDVLEYAYSYATIPETFATLLQENVHKALFVKVTDCPQMSAEAFEDCSKGYGLLFSDKLGLKGNDSYYQLDGDARLYIYEYQPEEGKSLPVWHLVCMK